MSSFKINLTKNVFGSAEISLPRLIGIFEPNVIKGNGLSDIEIENIVKSPLRKLPLKKIAKKKNRVLIVTDDITRSTPLFRILPPILNEIESAGLTRDRINILIALGTHRKMTEDEIGLKFGSFISSHYKIENHVWDDPDNLFSWGKYEDTFEIVLNKYLRDADLIISVGSIVPHATTGFSGGGKTIIPGICGEATIENTHWKALDFSMKEILGVNRNPIRNMIDEICRKIGLNMVVNTVLHNGDKIYGMVAGDPEKVFQEGTDLSREVYEVIIPKKADIVIAEAYPTDINLRQAIKAVCSADLVCRDGGIVILPAECPEGIASQFPEFYRYGFKDPDLIFQEVEEGRFKQKLLAYTLVAVGRIISKRVKAILVSPNITPDEAEQLGFMWAESLQHAVDSASEILGKRSTVMVLKQAGELLPKVQSE